MASTIPTTTNNSTTPTGQSSDDYQSLLNEIQNTIDKNDTLFKQIQQSNYPNAGSYTSDLLNYKIDKQVTDLTATRTQIWDFLNKKYSENTNLRAYYFDEIRKADEHISELTSQKNDLIDSVESKTTMSSTSDKSIRQEKYYFNKMEYYLFLYKILVISQIIILAVITICILGIIPKTTCLIITLIILIATVAFVGYYVFIVNIGRSSFSWTKFEHDNDSVSGNGKNSSKCHNVSSPASKADEKKALADKQINAIIQQSKSNIVN
jgi:hypothetical protein